MKAKIIETGEVIDLKGTSIEFGVATWIDSQNIMHQGNFPNGGVELLENTPHIDWEQRRYEIAKNAVAGILSGKNATVYAVHEAAYTEEEERTRPKAISRYAIACADALIEELKK